MNAINAKGSQFLRIMLPRIIKLRRKLGNGAFEIKRFMQV